MMPPDDAFTERARSLDAEADRRYRQWMQVQAEKIARRARGGQPDPSRYRNRDAPGATRRGVPADYAGDDLGLCNARTKSGRPCRAAALAHGRCKWHGGLSTGPKTPEGKAKVTLNLRRRK